VSASSSLCKGKKKILPNQTFFQNGCKKLSAELLEKSATPMTGIALNHYFRESNLKLNLDAILLEHFLGGILDDFLLLLQLVECTRMQNY